MLYIENVISSIWSGMILNCNLVPVSFRNPIYNSSLFFGTVFKVCSIKSFFILQQICLVHVLRQNIKVVLTSSVKTCLSWNRSCWDERLNADRPPGNRTSNVHYIIHSIKVALNVFLSNNKYSCL